MRTLFLLSFVAMACTAIPAFSAAARAAAGSRTRLIADFGWKFAKGDVAGAQLAGFDDGSWRTVNLPHDWSIEGPFSDSDPSLSRGGYLPAGIGWYRRTFKADSAWQGRKVFVEFDGVYMRSDVWINGHHLGNRPYGYISFEYDITPYLNFGKENVIAVRVDNSLQPSSRWYTGSGIYRNVWLTITAPVHIGHWGTYVTTPDATQQSAKVRIRTQVQNESAQTQSVTLTSQVIGIDGAVAGSADTTATIDSAGSQGFDQMVTVDSPKLWSVDTPNLYTVRSIVTIAGQVVDQIDTPIGIRSIVYDVDRGFILNGQPVKMLGMCLHHDGGCVGAAVPVAVWRRRLELLKAMGCNAIRTSHNPPAPEFLDLCDQLGFLVMDEAFDEWTQAKAKYGYSTIFPQWGQRDLTDQIHRDRNHPCVVMWSAGNEIGEQTMAGGADVLRPLVETFHREDPTRPVTAACDNVHTDTGDAKLDFLDLLDIVGYNYVDRWGARRETYYADDRYHYPARKFVGTEDSTGSGVRGEYDFGTVGTTQIPRALYAATMINLEQLWKFDATHDYVIGDFFWTGIDYLGESRWPAKNNSAGTMDTCGFPKDDYYLFQSQWTVKPMLHLFPTWNWAGREGQVIPVLCYTNCDTVELFLNGKSLGAKALQFPRPGVAGHWNTYATPPVMPTTADLHLSWDVPYAPGVLKAVGYKDGAQVCETEVATAGEPAAIVLTPDNTELVADGHDAVSIAVKIVDAQGNVVPDAADLITFDVQGAGSLIGLDNGDPTSHEDYQGRTRQAFHGLALAVVQASRKPGTIQITATADGLTPASVDLTVAKPAEAEDVLP